MSRYSRVAWKDGMILLPQHFQQAERAAEQSLSLRLEALGHPGWGVLQLAFQEGAIQQGRLELTRCQAILPDGTAISIPDVDAPPPARPLELRADKPGVDVYLTLPLARPRQPQVAVGTERADIRQREVSDEVPDDYDPSRLKALKVLSRQLRLVLEGEPLDDLASLKLGYVERRPGGELGFKASVVPPLLRLSAHEGLDTRMRNLHARVTARARSLLAVRAQRLGKDGSGSLVDGTPHDMLAFMFAQTLQVHAAQLRQLLEQPTTHPMALYHALVQLATALSSFDLKNQDDLPLYRQNQPGEAFSMVEQVIGTQLGRLFLSTFESIELTRRESRWHGVIGDGELRTRGQFLLGVSSTLSPRDIVGRLPAACKVSDVDTLESMVGTATGATVLTWSARLPSGLPAAPELTWFQVQMEAPELEKVRAGAPLGLYIPTWLPISRLELWGYLPTGGVSPA